jgi:phosphoribosylformylglycinamidine synthase
MVTTFFRSDSEIFAVQSLVELSLEDKQKLSWLLKASEEHQTSISGVFIGPRKEVTSPWSTNATDIANNVGIPAKRIESFRIENQETPIFDPMLEAVYLGLDQKSLVVDRLPLPTEARSD